MGIKKSIINSALLNQVIKFSYVGIGTNLAGYSIFLLLTNYYMYSPYLVITLLYPLGIFASYNLNKKYTFLKSKTAHMKKLAFVLIYFSGYLINLLVLFIAMSVFFLPSYFAQALAIIFLTFYLFFMQKNYVF